MSVNVRYYLTEQGANPVADYLATLPRERLEKVNALLRDLMAHGPEYGLIDKKPIKGKLWEFRVGLERLFYVRYSLRGEDRLTLLHAYQKQGQKAPRGEIDLATKRMEIHLAATAAANKKWEAEKEAERKKREKEEK